MNGWNLEHESSSSERVDVGKIILTWQSVRSNTRYVYRVQGRILGSPGGLAPP